MRILSLSTAESGAGLALFEGERLVCETYWESSKTHSKRLMQMVEQVVTVQAGLEIGDIDTFIAARGPGSFTGLRIGIGVIKGLAAAVGKPAIGISSLDGIAWRFSTANRPVCVMMDARRNEVYCAVYTFENGHLKEKSREQVCAPERILEAVEAGTLFAGSGAKAYQDLIRETLKGDVVMAPREMDGVSASALFRAAANTPGLLEKTETQLTPVYLRKSDAQIHLEAKAVKLDR